MTDLSRLPQARLRLRSSRWAALRETAEDLVGLAAILILLLGGLLAAAVWG